MKAIIRKVLFILVIELLVFGGAWLFVYVLAFRPLGQTPSFMAVLIGWNLWIAYNETKRIRDLIKAEAPI